MASWCSLCFDGVCANTVMQELMGLLELYSIK